MKVVERFRPPALSGWEGIVSVAKGAVWLNAALHMTHLTNKQISQSSLKVSLHTQLTDRVIICHNNQLVPLKMPTDEAIVMPNTPTS